MSILTSMSLVVTTLLAFRCFFVANVLSVSATQSMLLNQG